MFSTRQLQLWAVLVATFTLLIVAFGTFSTQSVVVGDKPGSYQLYHGNETLLCTITSNIQLDKEQYESGHTAKMTDASLLFDFLKSDLGSTPDVNLQFNYYYFYFKTDPATGDKTTLGTSGKYTATISQNDVGTVAYALTKTDIPLYNYDIGGGDYFNLQLVVENGNYAIIVSLLESYVGTWGVSNLGGFVAQVGEYEEPLQDPEPPEPGFASIMGNVKDSATAATIGGATVKIGNFTTATESDGHFEFVSLPEGNYTMSVAATGYKPYVSNIILEKDQKYTLRITLVAIGSTGTGTSNLDGTGGLLGNFEFNNYVIILAVALGAMIVLAPWIVAIIPGPFVVRFIIFLAIIAALAYGVYYFGTGGG